VRCQEDGNLIESQYENKNAGQKEEKKFLSFNCRVE